MSLLASGGVPRLKVDIGTPSAVQGFRASGDLRSGQLATAIQVPVSMRAADGSRMTYVATPRMITWINDGGVWRQSVGSYKSGGTWTGASPYIKVRGYWRPESVISPDVRISADTESAFVQDSGAVEYWLSSGVGSAASEFYQSNVLRRPTRSGTGATSQVAFGGVDVRMTASIGGPGGVMNSADDWHFFVVVTVNSISSNADLWTVPYTNNEILNNAENRGIVLSNNGLMTRIYAYEKVSDVVAPTGHQIPLGTMCLFEVSKFNGNLYSDIYFNDMEYLSSSSYAAPGSTQITGGLGATWSIGAEFDGAIHDIWLYNRALTGGHKQAVIDYLLAKWNIDPALAP